MGRPKGTYTTQQHQAVGLFDIDPSPATPAPVARPSTPPSTKFLTQSRATPAKAHNGEFPPEISHEKKSTQKSGPDLGKERSWVALRRKALAPRYVSELVTTPQTRAEFLEGARLLRFYGERAKPGARVLPQQLMLNDVLAAGHKRNAGLLPRRSTKTTSVIIAGLGRAAMREEYRVGIYTMTSGKAGRKRFLKDVVPPLEQLYPDKNNRPFKLIKIAGMEGVNWPEAGSITWLSSLDDIRGEAFDLLVLDEAGEENDADVVTETIGAALPTLDTRPGAQLVVLGTAGRYREGNLLWDALELGRHGRGGILEYSMPDDTTDDELAAWIPDELHPEGRVRELVLGSHPGVNTLTTLESIHENYVTMTGNGAKTESFAREYGGIFGELGETRGVFDVAKWTEQGRGGDLPTPPERFSLAMVAHPDQISAALVAAWRDDTGKAHGLLLEHRHGVEWLAAEAAVKSRKYKTPLVYDTGSQVILLTVEALNRQRNRPRMHPFAFMDIKKAAALLVDEIRRGNVVHYRQPELDNAIKTAVKRKAGVNGWALGRPIAEADIVAAEGLALALLAYDDAPKQTSRPETRVRT